MLQGAYSLLGAIGGRSGGGGNVFGVYYHNKNLSRSFPGHWGVGWDGWQWVALDDMFYN